MTAALADAPLLEALAERARATDLVQLDARLRASGGCARPIRLKGSIEVCEAGGRKRVWSTDAEPDGVLRKACGNRREAICPSCAERYRGDAYQLIAAGLRGGKGLPDSVAEHPAIFATLTAPSFGPVHTRPLGPDGQPRRCRPRRDDPVCPHGVRLSCAAVHDDGDPRLGDPLCPACFDHAAAVTWNNSLGALWRYTTIGVPRAMARRCGITNQALWREVRPAYVKVAEYQRRGLVHLHVLARLDRAMPDYRADEVRPPSPRFDAQLLEDALRDVVADVSAPIAKELGDGRVRWGRQLDVRQLNTGAERGEIAGYLAKYATKSTEQAGALLHRVTRDQLDDVNVREHVRSYMRAAFDLDDVVAEHRKHQAQTTAPSRNVETNWNPAALAIRVRCAMATNEPLRIRPHVGETLRGRVVRLVDDAPERGNTTLAVELDCGACIHLADVASIGPDTRRARRREPRLAECAHALGYRGHCLTKSRRYSTTFRALRAAREAYVHAQLLARSTDATQRAIAAGGSRTSSFVYVGTGHVTAADAFLAASAAARAREHRRLAREEAALALHGVRDSVQEVTR